jgi:hypothetical protein
LAETAPGNDQRRKGHAAFGEKFPQLSPARGSRAFSPRLRSRPRPSHFAQTFVLEKPEHDGVAVLFAQPAIAASSSGAIWGQTSGSGSFKSDCM